MIQKGLIVFASMILTLGGYPQTSPSTNRNRICWDTFRKLSWSDFQAVPADTGITFLGIPSIAASAISMECHSSDNDPNSYTIICYFDKSKSWAKDTSRLLLTHEQLHFDIFELFARKLRKTLDSLNASGLRDTSIYIHSINRAYAKRDSFSERYDIETGHGIAKVFQDDWNQKVNKDLKGLEMYASKLKECELITE